MADPGAQATPERQSSGRDGGGLVQRLQIVEGDFVVQNNPMLQSLEGTAQSLTTVLGQVMRRTAPRRSGASAMKRRTALLEVPATAGLACRCISPTTRS